jgi:hypothetical protein
MADPFAAFARRLVPRFDAGAWPVLVVNAVPAQSHETRDAIVRTPAHWLAAAWPPPARGLTRFPEAVVIGAPAADNALAELCTRLPADAGLWLADPDAVDGALAADVLLAADRNLEDYQRAALAQYAAAERARTARCIVRDYTDHDAGFARFRASLHGNAPGAPGAAEE